MSPHPDVVALAGDLLPYSLAYKTGSHQFGLNTPDSDIDWTVIYHHAEDHRRLFRLYPDVLHSESSDHKLYSLRKLGEMLMKGNPNVVELVANLRPEYVAGRDQPQEDIADFMAAVRPYLVTQRLAAAYLGHLQGIRKEIVQHGITPKRLSHAIRMARCGEFLLSLRTVPDFRQMPSSRRTAYDIKVGTTQITAEYAEARLRAEEELISEAYAKHKNDLPDGSTLKAAINDFFVSL